MKTIFKTGILVFLLGSMLITSGCAKDLAGPEYIDILDVNDDGTTRLLISNLKSVLSDDMIFEETELQMLLHMKEEEKLARDVYIALFDKWGYKVFQNISEAEDNHLNAIIFLLKNYGSEYTKINEKGIFSDPEFQELYKELVAKGSVSLAEAFKTGALIEEMDIKDLNEYLDKVGNENIRLVFENLNRGSRNHLRAFNNHITRLGLTYTPVYISQDEYDQIISSQNESGNPYRRNENGRYKRRYGQGS